MAWLRVTAHGGRLWFCAEGCSTRRDGRYSASAFGGPFDPPRLRLARHMACTSVGVQAIKATEVAAVPTASLAGVVTLTSAVRS